MMLHGDELGRSQQGNNNVYCQDNELSWMDWDLAGLAEGAARVHQAGGQRCATSTRCSGAAGSSPARSPGPAGDAADIAWFNPDGKHKDDWGNADDKALMVFLNGDGIPEPGRRGEPVVDDSFLIAFNAGDTDDPVHDPRRGVRRGLGASSLDTHDDAAGSVSFFDEAVSLLPGLEFEVADRSVVVLRRPR